MLKEVLLAPFELVAMHFGLWKVPQCFENRPFWDKRCVQNRQKFFSQVKLEHLACTNK